MKPASGTPRQLTLDDHDSIKSPDSLSFSRDARQIACVLEEQIHTAFAPDHSLR